MRPQIKKPARTGQCNFNLRSYFLPLPIQPQRQLATEQEKRETDMHTYKLKQAKTRLDVDAKMTDDARAMDEVATERC